MLNKPSSLWIVTAFCLIANLEYGSSLTVADTLERALKECLRKRATGRSSFKVMLIVSVRQCTKLKARNC